MALSACGPLVSKPQLLQRDPPGPELTECPPEPPREPETYSDERARYQWAGEAILAGRACRETLAKLKGWALNPPGDTSR